MASTNFTNSVTLTDAAWFDDVDIKAYSYLTGVAGTNTITANGPVSLEAYAAGRVFQFIPANTNTGATTINITGASALGARNIFSNGAACVGGELRINVPVQIIDDGTRFHIIGNAVPVPFVDTYPVVVGSADSTKKVRFEVDGLTTATTRIITVPDQDFTLFGSGGGTVTGDITMSGASIIEAEGAAVASAATCEIWATDGGTRHITGTTTITSLGTATQAGQWQKIIFDGALTLTHGANLNLPSGANITTAADDFAWVYADTTTQHDVLYFRKDGKAVSGSGKLLQVVTATYATQVNNSTSTYADTGLTATITPTLSTSTILVLGHQGGVSKDAGDTSVNIKLFRGATDLGAIHIACANTASTAANNTGAQTISYPDSPASVSALTYKTQFASDANIARATVQYGNSKSVLILMEIAA